MKNPLANAVLFALTASVAHGQVINEIRVDQPGSDLDEYFELRGVPGASLDGLTYIVIGDGAPAAGSGVIEEAEDLSGLSIPASGYFVAAESGFTLGTADLTTALSFENSDNVTHLLVHDFVGSIGADLDLDDDGLLDVTPWTSVVDVFALVEEANPPAATEFTYGPPGAGPDGGFVPGHAFRQSVDGSLTQWAVGRFDPVGGLDTPGADNATNGRLSAADGGSVSLQVSAPPVFGGFLYFIAFGLSGTTPGTTVPSGLLLPLNFDTLFALSLTNAGAGPFQGSLGMLDGVGQSPFARLVLPSVPALAGATLNAAGMVINPISVNIPMVTAPIEVVLD